jgi:hypothetical protein
MSMATARAAYARFDWHRFIEALKKWRSRQRLVPGAATASAALLLAAGSAPVEAAAFPSGSIFVGGMIGDWGVAPANNNGSTYPTISNANTYNFVTTLAPNALGLIGNPHVEDQDDNAGTGGFVGPHNGGQNYDAEYMAVAIHAGPAGTLAGSKIVIAIMSGQRPDNGSLSGPTRYLFGPGDIMITAGGTTWGIEVGGGSPTGPGTAQAEGANGSTYGLDGSGYTLTHTSSAAVTVGSMWENPGWLASTVDGVETQIDSANPGTFVQTADFVATWNDTPAGYNQHSIIELSIDAGFLQPYVDANGDLVFSIFWGTACDNDFLLVDASLHVDSVPAPTGGLIFAGALGGLGALGRRRAKRAA